MSRHPSPIHLRDGDDDYDDCALHGGDVRRYDGALHDDDYDNTIRYFLYNSYFPLLFHFLILIGIVRIIWILLVTCIIRIIRVIRITISAITKSRAE